jgi:hypothetical protein
MKSAKDIICLVADAGLFVHVARRLAREFKTVYYWSPWENAFPHFRDDIIGDGYSEIIRVESVESVASEIDLAVFPDIGYSDLQKQFIERGIPVWGCRNGDELEARRGKFLDVLKNKTNLPVPKAEKVKGITNLRLFLQDNPDQYIKVDTYRGDFETFHFHSMAEDENIIDEMAAKLGPLKENLVFWVFAPIDTEIEDGIDTYCIDGQWPETIIHGLEKKDQSYIGAFQKFADCPEEVRCVNESFSPILESYGYRGMFCTEVRITKEGESYFIDPTCRMPSPPSQCMCEMIGNLGEIIWQGANGILVEPEQTAKFGAQAIFKVDRDHWGVFDIPEEIDPFVKISFSCRSNGKICVPPDPQGVSEIGWCVGIGDTIEEAVDHLREVVDQMPEGVHVEFSSLADLMKELQAAKEVGVEMTDQTIPDPADIIE